MGTLRRIPLVRSKPLAERMRGHRLPKQFLSIIRRKRISVRHLQTELLPNPEQAGLKIFHRRYHRTRNEANIRKISRGTSGYGVEARSVQPIRERPRGTEGMGVAPKQPKAFFSRLVWRIHTKVRRLVNDINDWTSHK